MDRELLIRRASYFGVEPRARRAAAGALELPFAEVKRWLTSGALVRHLLQYPRVELVTHRIDHLAKPFQTALMVRLLSRGRCLFSDDGGRELEITPRVLLFQLARYAKELVALPLLLARIRLEIRRHERQAAGGTDAPATDLSRSPLYLRSDLLFGIGSGGSVGHIAGVVNHLQSFTGPPILVTTDRIPTVRSDVETHVVVPGGEFCSFPEIPSLHFSRVLTARVLESLAGRRPSFVYQRYSLNNLSGLELSRRLRVPFVLEYNGSEVWISRNWGEPLRHERISRRIESLLLRSADVVVVVSAALRDDLLALGVAPQRLLVNPNGVDAERYSPAVDGAPVRRRLGLEAKRVLGFIGTFGRWHGAEVLAGAFGRLMQRRPDWRASVRLLLIGDGLTMPQVRADLERHGVSELCVLTGLVAQEQGPEHLAACDLLIAPHRPNADGTRFFGSPTKVFEYMAMAKGIVASDLGQIGEVLRHGETGWLVEPGNEQALAAAMEHLLEQPAVAERLGHAARQQVLARHTWKQHTERIIQRLSGDSGASVTMLDAREIGAQRQHRACRKPDR